MSKDKMESKDLRESLPRSGIKQRVSMKSTHTPFHFPLSSLDQHGYEAKRCNSAMEEHI